jgi:two-component system NtrC family sensor kinase
MRVLLVDDDLFVLRGLSRMLRPHSVSMAPGGNSALALIKEGKTFDAIVCDLNMPAMRGDAFYEAVNALNPDLAKHIVFMTGGACTDRDRSFLEHHIGLAKPFDREEFERACEALAEA